jgi:hypothetical protein
MNRNCRNVLEYLVLYQQLFISVNYHYTCDYVLCFKGLQCFFFQWLDSPLGAWTA